MYIYIYIYIYIYVYVYLTYLFITRPNTYISKQCQLLCRICTYVYCSLFACTNSIIIMSQCVSFLYSQRKLIGIKPSIQSRFTPELVALFRVFFSEDLRSHRLDARL